MAVILSVLSGGSPAGAQPTVTAVRLGEHTDKTRFVMDVTEQVGFRLFTLPDPFRVVIDMPAVAWQLPDGAFRGAGLIEGLRYGLFRPDTSRVVIDLKRPVAVKEAFFLPPTAGNGYRFVLDLEPADRGRFLRQQAGTLQKAAAHPPAPPVMPARRQDKYLVVVDPGHGGVDPGAIGVSGIHEKKIALSTAQEVRRLLEASGRYRVVMTRDRDIFVPLSRRVEIAQQAQADLFVSLHADAIRDRSVRGASIYTLSETASDKLAAEIASGENRADIIAGIDLSEQSPEVSNILIDLARRETMNISSQFAEMMKGELGRSTRLLSNPHRYAGFVVLKAPDVPSILIEMGFMSNPQDEKLLRQPAHRRKLAEAIRRAVDAWFARRERLSRS